MLKENRLKNILRSKYKKSEAIDIAELSNLLIQLYPQSVKVMSLLDFIEELEKEGIIEICNINGNPTLVYLGERK